MLGKYLLVYCCIFLVAIVVITAYRYVEGDVCTFRGATGTCRQSQLCNVLRRAFNSNQITLSDIESCGFSVYDELVCCPNSDIFSLNSTTVSNGTTIDFWSSVLANHSTSQPLNPTPTPTLTPTPVPDTNDDDDDDEDPIELRASEKACLTYKPKHPKLTTHILDGLHAHVGEYPHMAAIVLTNTVDNITTVKFGCGGTLIHERFVLTAAHCVTKRDYKPTTVRLGLVRLDDDSPGIEERQITRIHVHPFYSEVFKVHDIAILELSQAVNMSSQIRPACLYTKMPDPTPNELLSISAFGSPSREPNSEVLLKAHFQVQSLTDCQQVYKREKVRLIPGHMCAFDPDHRRELCDGSSGGPLDLLNDNFFTQAHFVVGIVQAGFGCDSRMPLLLTRVAFYLDYIEEIVWPNGDTIPCELFSIR